MDNITFLTVCSNTKELMRVAYESIRKFHPSETMIIIDGSDYTDPCYIYVNSLFSEYTKVFSFGFNIGHGAGMHEGLKKITTKYAVVFDCDIEMVKSPIEKMLSLMEEDSFGVGCYEYTGSDGHVYGVQPWHKKETPTIYLMPFFQLINVANYFKYPPYVHHGAPCYKTMNYIKKLGISEKILKSFPPERYSLMDYVHHLCGGTRHDRMSKGLSDIEGGWV